jgi:protein-tyrosine phosphatase
MPSAPWTETMYQELEAISVKRGLTPVIAHVDRYIGPFCAHRIPQRLAALPVLVQANAEFFLKSGTTRMALRLLREDKIHLLGSDCHNLVSRAPNLGVALTKIEKKLGKDILKRVHTHENQVFNTDGEM